MSEEIIKSLAIHWREGKNFKTLTYLLQTNTLNIKWPFKKFENTNYDKDESIR